MDGRNQACRGPRATIGTDEYRKMHPHQGASWAGAQEIDRFRNNKAQGATHCSRGSPEMVGGSVPMSLTVPTNKVLRGVGERVCV